MNAFETREFSGGTVGGLLAARSSYAPDSPALIWGDSEFSYKAVDEYATQVASGLLALGLHHGDAVSIFLRNCSEYIFSWYGIVRAGLIEVPINTAYKGQFLQQTVAHSGSRAIITESRLGGALAELGGLPDDVGIVIFIDEIPEGWPGLSVDTITWNDLIKLGDPRASFPEVRLDDTSAILYTSGTTGQSKGVVLPHFNNVVFGREAAVAMNTTPKDRLHTCLPLFHGNAQWATCMHAMYAGAAVVLSRRFSASGFWKEVRESRATEFNALGSMLHMLLAQPPSPLDKNHHVERAFVAPAPADVLYRFESRFGVHIIEGYGLTEIKNVTYNPWQGRKVGSMGRPTASSILDIHDEFGNAAAPGHVGEIVYRPKMGNIMFKGYHRDPDATMETSQDMWWHTGDLGFRDVDDFYYFVDRKKDAMRRRGENISSQEVEGVLMGHTSVVEAAAIAVKSDVGEDEVMVVLQAPKGTRVDLADVFEHCDRAMPYFMVPRYFRVMDDLPRTSNGKVQKAVLREAGVTPDTWDATAAGLAPTRQI